MHGIEVTKLLSMTVCFIFVILFSSIAFGQSSDTAWDARPQSLTVSPTQSAEEFEELSNDIQGASVNGETLFTHSSDGLFHQITRFDAHEQRDNEKTIQYYGGQFLLSSGRQGDQKYNGTTGALVIGTKLRNGTQIRGKGGISQLRNQFENQSQDETDEAAAKSVINQTEIPYWELSTQLNLSDRTYAELKMYHDFVYHEWVDAAAAVSRLSGRTLFASIESNPSERWRIRSEGRVVDLSDSNQQRTLDTVGLRQVYNSNRISVRTGVGVNVISFRDTYEDYWSPHRFFATAFRSESEWRISLRLKGELNVNLGLSRDGDNGLGIDNYQEARLRYIKNQSWNASVVFIHMQTAQEKNNWERNDVGINLSTVL